MVKQRGNAGRGLILGISTTVILTVLIHIFQLAQGVQQLRELNKKPEPPVLEKYKDGYTRIIITDTVTGRIDTMRLVDYMVMKREGFDTVNKKTELFYPGVKYQ